MSRRYFKINLSDDVEIHVFFETASGFIINFMVKLVLKLEDIYHEVVRFDSGHNCPHKDILNGEGKVVRKVWYEFADNQQALDLGIKDLKDNYQFYIERFTKWLQE